MRPKMLSRFLTLVVACASLGATASDVFAQTQQLDRTLVRKFPEGFCPLDTQLIGTFHSDTGIIQLTFISGLGGGTVANGTADTFLQILDDISIIEAAEFAANSIPDEVTFCYFDSDPHVPVYTGVLTGNPKVPFFDGLNPSTSPCPWDESNGFTITANGLEYTGGGDIATTSVVISGLVPGTEYIIHGRWKANGFAFATDCSPTSLCLTVQVDDLESGCGTLSTETKTWGAVKSLYKN